MPLDLIVPFYGRPEHLHLLVESVLGQTSPEWRLVIVDDNWPGESVEPWLTAVGDPRVSYVRNPRNLGVNANFRHCLTLAQADYVAFPGCDDMLLPTYVEVVLAAALRTGADVLQPGVRVIDMDGAEGRAVGDRIKDLLRPAAGIHHGEDLAVSLARGNWTYFPSICWRTAAAVRHSFAPGMDVVLDLALLLDLVQDDARVAVVDDVCFQYRRHSESVSSQAAVDLTRFAEERTFYDNVATRFRARGWDRAASAARRRVTSRLHAALLVPGRLRHGQPAAAFGLVTHALR